eukprot:TRINITY_DN2925_c0_g1_i2.p4 TRINITY_DN2925_c0_g1~~TRINITY_DN2925_c0_g1_i2.p4  ORF type:complete len:230 (+),score=-2.90 TRINITY_DN2925_c0_g1_i2:1148-1837(+)
MLFNTTNYFQLASSQLCTIFKTRVRCRENFFKVMQGRVTFNINARLCFRSNNWRTSSKYATYKQFDVYCKLCASILYRRRLKVTDTFNGCFNVNSSLFQRQIKISLEQFIKSKSGDPPIFFVCEVFLVIIQSLFQIWYYYIPNKYMGSVANNCASLCGDVYIYVRIWFLYGWGVWGGMIVIVVIMYACGGTFKTCLQCMQICILCLQYVFMWFKMLFLLAAVFAQSIEI